MPGRLTRFLNLERPRTSQQAESPTPLNSKRFEPRSEVELAQDFGEQPFVRCPYCEADNGKFSEKCLNCAQPLNTTEVKLWNEQFWAARQEQASAEQQQQVEREQQLQADRRALGEAIAREVGERERSKWRDSTPLGFKLLQRLDEEQRAPAFFAAVGLFVLSGAMAIGLRGHSALQLTGMLIALALLFLFVPNNRRY